MTNAYCCEAAILATTIWRICTHMSRVRDHRGQSRLRSGQRLCPQRGFAIAGRGREPALRAQQCPRTLGHAAKEARIDFSLFCLDRPPFVIRNDGSRQSVAVRQS